MARRHGVAGDETAAARGVAVKYRCVMTMNGRIWQDYGRRAVESFLEFWPDDVVLDLYAESFRVEYVLEHPRLNVRPMPGWHNVWKSRHRDNADANGLAGPKRPYDYHRDAVKFSHKVAALTDAAVRRDWGSGDVQILMDADVVTHAPVDAQWLGELFPSGHYMAWLARAGHYPECGFVMFRAGHHVHKSFMTAFESLYRYDGLFKLRETHDSFALQEMVNGFVKAGLFGQPHDLSGVRGAENRSHPFVRSRLGERMDHLKGKRKVAGRTDPAEAKRNGGYWQR